MLRERRFKDAAVVFQTPENCEFGDVIVAFDGVIVIIEAKSGHTSVFKASAKLCAMGLTPREYSRPSDKGLTVFQ